MKRMGGLDASFLYGEQGAVMLHTLKIAVVRVPDDMRSALFGRLHRVMAANIDQLPSFRWLAVRVPADVFHPMWVEDPSFALERHLHRADLGEPGDHAALDRLISKIAAQPLPRDRPLWALWMVEGLADGRVAFIAKMHHAIADGTASAAMLAAVMTGDVPLHAAPRARPTERMPRPLELMKSAARDRAQVLGRLPELVRETAKRGVRIAEARRGPAAEACGPFSGPRTRFNTTLSPKRSFASLDVPLAPIIALRRKLGVTVNDLILTIAGEALRSWLEEQGDVLNAPLLATVPVVDSEGSSGRTDGNLLSNLFCSMATDVPDLLERVQVVHRKANAAKALHTAVGADIMHRWAEYLPAIPYRGAMRMVHNLKLTDTIPPPANAIVSNVRGPSFQATLAGAVIEQFYSVGPLMDGLGVNITAWSYADTMSFSILADGRVIEDASVILQRIPSIIARLQKGA